MESRKVYPFGAPSVNPDKRSSPNLIQERETEPLLNPVEKKRLRKTPTCLDFNTTSGEVAGSPIEANFEPYMSSSGAIVSYDWTHVDLVGSVPGTTTQTQGTDLPKDTIISAANTNASVTTNTSGNSSVPLHLSSQHDPLPLSGQRDPLQLSGKRDPPAQQPATEIQTANTNASVTTNTSGNSSVPLHLSSQHGPLQLSGQHDPLQLSGKRDPPAQQPATEIQMANTNASVTTNTSGNSSVPLHLSSQQGPLQLSSQHDPLQLSGQHDPLQLSGQNDPLQLSGQHDPLQLSGQHDPLPLSGQRDPLQLSGKRDPPAQQPATEIQTDDVEGLQGALKVQGAILTFFTTALWVARFKIGKDKEEKDTDELIAKGLYKVGFGLAAGGGLMGITAWVYLALGWRRVAAWMTLVVHLLILFILCGFISHHVFGFLSEAGKWTVLAVSYALFVGISAFPIYKRWKN